MRNRLRDAKRHLRMANPPTEQPRRGFRSAAYSAGMKETIRQEGRKIFLQARQRGWEGRNFCCKGAFFSFLFWKVRKKHVALCCFKIIFHGPFFDKRLHPI